MQDRGNVSRPPDLLAILLAKIGPRAPLGTFHAQLAWIELRRFDSERCTQIAVSDGRPDLQYPLSPLVVRFQFPARHRPTTQRNPIALLEIKFVESQRLPAPKR